MSVIKQLTALIALLFRAKRTEKTLNNGIRMTGSESNGKKQAKKSPAPWHAVPCGDTKPIYIYSAYSEEEKKDSHIQTAG